MIQCRHFFLCISIASNEHFHLHRYYDDRPSNEKDIILHLTLYDDDDDDEIEHNVRQM